MLRHFTFLGVLAAVAASFFGVLAYGGGDAHATSPVTVTAFASGLINPADTTTPPACNFVSPGFNGPTYANFTINSANSGPLFPCGDGQDEFTNWTFDFTAHANYQEFLGCMNADNGTQLTSASLVLFRADPTGGNGGYYDTSTDGIGMLGKDPPGLAPPGPNLSSTPQNNAIQSWTGGQLTHDWITGSIGFPEPGLFSNPNVWAIRSNFLASGVVTPFNNPPIPYTATTGQIAMQYQDDALIYYAQFDLTCGTPPVGGVVDLRTNTDSADSAADVSGSSIASDYTSPVVAAIAAAFVALVAGGWYARRRWLS